MKLHSNVSGLFRVCVTPVVLIGGSASLQAADWPNYRGANYDGISDETGWQSTWQDAPTIAWKASLRRGFRLCRSPERQVVQ
ncbi:MAG: hypothetical protein JSW27_09265 [Phycisphaerales bacterium]|nr:MAG: hypothetical protein JSW27_09265 [Phycisphaerales bacterium]